MADQNTPNTNANKTKAEGERWSSEHANTDNAGGITNRPLDEERENQDALPPRGTSRDEGRNLGVGDEVEADREEGRSER